jgi:arsenical pump membrane protein
VGLTLALTALAVVPGFALLCPRGWPEAVVAVPAAGILIALGVLSPADAAAEVNRLLPVVGFLAAVLVLARLCDDEGLFRAAGEFLTRAGRRRSATAAGHGVRHHGAADGVAAEPHAYATAHLANTASLLLPVSNLTNLLAFGAAGLSFLHFAGLMTLPWLLAIAVEFAVFRWVFRCALATEPQPDGSGEQVYVPVFVLVLLGLTLLGLWDGDRVHLSRSGTNGWPPKCSTPWRFRTR